MRWCALVTLGLAINLPIPVRAYPQPDAPVSMVTHGLKITLDLSRRAYPRNALVQVTLSIRNISRHAVSVMSGLNSPQVAVFTASGQEVDDPINPLGVLTLISPRGPGPQSFRLLPHRVWTVHDYVVLHGNTLVARVILGDASTAGQEVSITRPRLSLRLTSEPSPQVVLSTAPLRARLIPPSPESTPVLSFSQEQCDSVSTGNGWVTGDQGNIPPGSQGACTTYIWHAIAGWLNHPVATITYLATPTRITISTTPPPRLKPPDAHSPAAGVCARAVGAVAMLQINVDTPSPRCEVVTPEQRLRVVNTTDGPVRVRLAHIAVRLGPRQDLIIDQPFGAYLAPGVHDLAISAYAGGGAELWLRA